MKMNKNENGFTLIELLAVVVILGIIMLIAIPNIISTLDKNKKDTLLKDAQRMVSAAEYKMTSPSSEEPNSNKIIIIALKDLPTASLKESPYGTNYSQTKSFVAVTKDQEGTRYRINYYAHLMACTDDDCTTNSRDNRGVNLSKVDSLDTAARFDLVVDGAALKRNLINDQTNLTSLLHKEVVTYQK